ncbi:hypothetical protein BDB13_5928 [Rhodococcus sp. OK302]|nr:hypothetical protein BDB13_5928 [Rhodococcus sp. OK302]
MLLGETGQKSSTHSPSDTTRYCSPPAPIDIEAGANDRGQSFGTGEGVESGADLPDLIAAIGTNGDIGYIQKDAFGGPAATPEQALASGPGARTVPPYDQDAHCHRRIRHLLMQECRWLGSSLDLNYRLSRQKNSTDSPECCDRFECLRVQHD